MIGIYSTAPNSSDLRRESTTSMGGADGTASGPSTNPSRKVVDDILERIADLEQERPGGYVGGVSESPRRESATSLMESKLILGLGPLADDKAAFRQWDLKLTPSSG